MYIAHDSVPAAAAPVQESETKLNRYNYDATSGGTNVTTAAYVQLVAATAIALKGLDIFDSSGQTMVIAFGAAASEVDQFFVFPGGQNLIVRKAIPAGTRISIKAVSATADIGENTINGIA